MARLQLDLSETSDDVIVTLMKICDLRTKKDVVENALMLLGWAASEVQRGGTIAAVDEKNKVFKEIQIPALIGAKFTASKALEIGDAVPARRDSADRGEPRRVAIT